MTVLGQIRLAGDTLAVARRSFDEILARAMYDCRIYGSDIVLEWEYGWC